MIRQFPLKQIYRMNKQISQIREKRLEKKEKPLFFLYGDEESDIKIVTVQS